MDTKTPSIPLKHQERKDHHCRKQDKSSEPVSLPPLTSLPNGKNLQHQRRQDRTKNLGNSAPWTRTPPYVARNCDHQRQRLYRVLHIGATPLMHACQQADRSRVLRLLKEQEETIGYRDRKLRSALHYCMDAGTGGVVASAAPELVNAPDAEGHRPLHLAVIAGDTQLAAVLLANGGDVNAKDLEGHSILHWATVCGEAECVRLVLAAGARPSIPDLRGGSPLHYAAQCCGAAVTAELSVPKKIGQKVLQTLLEFGANVNAKDEDGRQPILWAASAGSVEAVLALARAGGSAAAGATDKDGLTALHCAASRGHARCVEALVNLCGSHPDHVDDNGCSALHYAATLGHADATALLLRLGADPNRQDRKGRTPALCAAAKGQLETLKILAQHGGSLYARTVRGTGVAHEAVLSGRIELIEWLAKKRPSTLDVATHYGKTPLHVAALHGYLDVCKVLLDHGARINAVLRTTKSGPMTALDAALHRGHRDCAKLVQMHGGRTAQHLRTHNTAPDQVFAAKLRVKHGNDSSDSEVDSIRRGCNYPKTDPYFEERWIEKRTHRRGLGIPLKSSNERRDSRSYSEEEIRRGKTSTRHTVVDRRARSESSRYEKRLEYSDRCYGAKKCEKTHEYGESSGVISTDTEMERETIETSRSREDYKFKKERKLRETATASSDDVTRSSTENDASATEDSADFARSLSDDSLEVVVVRTSLEKTSEKVHAMDKNLKAPKETSRETRITETRRSRKKSKTPRSKMVRDNKNDDGTVKVKKHRKKRDETIDDKKDNDSQGNDNVRKKMVDKSKRKNNEFRKDDTDSTSQETVERVTITALVHKDQAPDTPKSNKLSRDDDLTARRQKLPVSKAETGTPSVTCEITEILDKADELQNKLLTKAGDLRKDVEVLRRQMGDNATKQDSGVDKMSDTRENDEKSAISDEPVTITGKSKVKKICEISSDDSARLRSRDDKSSMEHCFKEICNDKNLTNESTKKNEVSTRSENHNAVTAKNEKSLQDNEKREKKEDYEEAVDLEKLSNQKVEGKISQTSVAFSSISGDDKCGENSPDLCLMIQSDEEKIDENKNLDPNDATRSDCEQILTDGKTAENEKEKTNKEEKFIVDISGNEDGEGGILRKMRFIDSPLGSTKFSRMKNCSRPSKRSLYESSEEHSPDRGAIIAVIEGPAWDENEDIEEKIRDVVGVDAEEPETEPEDALGVLRVLPSTSEEETPRIGNKLLRTTRTKCLPRVERRLRIKNGHGEGPTDSREIKDGRVKQRRDSGGMDSGIEPSPRVSKIPKRTTRYCPNTEKQQALNMETVTRDVQISLRRYHLERKIFFQLMELKRLQIRHGRANEHVLVKRQVQTFHKAGMTGPTLGVAKYDQPLTFRHFEAFLYEQLRRLQRRSVIPDFCTEAKQCIQKTHRCHHATSAYTSVPVYTYLGGGGQGREEGLLPRIESRGRAQMTVEVTRGAEKQVIALPAEKLDRTKIYYITFTVKGEEHDPSSGGIERTQNRVQRKTKSV